MKKFLRTFFLLRNLTAVIVLLIITLTSCTNSYAIDKGHDAGLLKVGLIPEISIGIRSKTDEFDIDDVTLEFSWGNEDGIDEGDCVFIDRGGKGVMPEECPVIGVAVYFYNYEYRDRLSSTHHYDDYKEIDGAFFVKDFTVEEFNEKCKVDLNYWGRKKYDHTETLTVPKEVFEPTTGIFRFAVNRIVYIPSENAYLIYGGGYENLEYKFLKNDKIKLDLY